MWRLSVLRGFALLDPGGAEFATRSWATRELICILALSGPAGANRQTLAQQLFGDAPNPDKALANILHRFRGATETHRVPLIEVVGSRLYLANADVDVFSLFETIGLARPSAGAVEAALSLLDGPGAADLMSGSYRTHLVATLREELCGRLLTAFASWAQTPSGDRWRPRLLSALALIRGHLPYNRVTVERLLLIFGGLGLVERLYQTYEEYETFLNDEFGTRIPRDVESLVDELVTALDLQQKTESSSRVHSRRRGAALPGVHLIAGHSGIGKSSVLQHLANSGAFSGLRRSWVDLAQEDPDKSFATMVSLRPETLFVDHYKPQHGAFVERIRAMLPETRIYVAGVSPAGLGYTTILMLQPLASSARDAENPSVQMARDRLERYGALETSPDRIARIAELSGGVPYVVDVLARLAATAGLDACVGYLEASRMRQPGSPERWDPLRDATRASIAALSVEARLALALLSRLDASASVDALLATSDFSGAVVEELVVSGLVRKTQEGMAVEVHGVSLAAIGACTRPFADDAVFAGFLRRLAGAVLAHPARNIGGSEAARQTAQTLVNRLVDVDPLLGLEILEEVRHLFAPGIVLTLDEVALKRYLELNELEPDHFATAVLGYGALLFKQLRYGEMREMLELRCADPRILLASDAQAGNLLAQRGLALRGLLRFEEALSFYEAARERAIGCGDRRSMAKISYSIAALYGQMGARAEEAIPHLDLAIELLAETPNTAVKVELLQTRAILRNEAGASLVEVEDELNSALAHAARFGLARQVAWIAQNLGLVYGKHGRHRDAAVCECCGIWLEVGAPDGMSRESLRRIHSSLGTLGGSMQRLGNDRHAFTCRSMLDRVGAYEVFVQSQPSVSGLRDGTYRGSSSWEEFPPSPEELRGSCSEWLSAVIGASAEGESFLRRLDALAGGLFSDLLAGSDQPVR